MLTDPNVDSPANIDAAVRSTLMLQLTWHFPINPTHNVLLVLVFIDSQLFLMCFFSSENVPREPKGVQKDGI
jgi:hypothetical protein